MRDTGILTHPIDKDNESLIIANAIQNPANREIFVRKADYTLFRLKEYQTLAWGILEVHKAGIEFNNDALLIKAQACPVRYTVELPFIQNLLEKIATVPVKNFIEHLEKLTVDSVKQKMIDYMTTTLLPACTNPTITLSDLDQRFIYGKTIIEKGYSSSKLGFKNMAEVAADYDTMKVTGISKRPTGFIQLDRHLTEGFKDGQITTITALASQGKCMKKGTEIMMFDCSFKKIEDIIQGDILMGPDSKPRKVLSTTNGYGKMYKICQGRGDDYYVNDKHILSLVRCKEAIRTKIGAKKGSTIISGYKDNGELLNISVEDACKKPNYFFDRYKGYKAILEFDEKPISLEPYFVGVWLGDGTNSTSAITTQEPEIRDYLKEYSKKIGMRYHEIFFPDKHCFLCRISRSTHRGDTTLYHLRKYDLLNNKHIPKEYLYNSKDNRMQLLAGLLDTDGYVMTKTIHEISTKYDQLKDDILFLARSLGFYCSATLEEKGIKSTGFKGLYWRIRISGYNHLIPTKVMRKKAQERTKKYKPTETVIALQPSKKTEYYGFELGGDGLYILKDFTVTHNSSFCLSVMKNLSQLEQPAPVAQFALEMNNTSLFTKLLAFRTNLPISTIVKKPEDLSEDERRLYEWEKTQLAANKHIFLNDRPSQSIASIREQILLLQDHIKQQYMVVVIDLFGKLSDLQSSDNFARDYEQKLNGIQVMVRELGIHMILVAQLNREVGKKNRRPTMNDLKNSHALTEVSDIIMGIHRPYYDAEKTFKQHQTYGMVVDKEDDYEEYDDLIEADPNQNVAEVIILKQRMGPKDVLENFMFDPRTTCFSPITAENQQQLAVRRLSEDDESA